MFCASPSITGLAARYLQSEWLLLQSHRFSNPARRKFLTPFKEGVYITATQFVSIRQSLSDAFSGPEYWCLPETHNYFYVYYVYKDYVCTL